MIGLGISLIYGNQSRRINKIAKPSKHEIQSAIDLLVPSTKV